MFHKLIYLVTRIYISNYWMWSLPSCKPVLVMLFCNSYFTLIPNKRYHIIQKPILVQQPWSLNLARITFLLVLFFIYNSKISKFKNALIMDLKKYFWDNATRQFNYKILIYFNSSMRIIEYSEQNTSYICLFSQMCFTLTSAWLICIFNNYKWDKWSIMHCPKLTALVTHGSINYGF